MKRLLIAGMAATAGLLAGCVESALNPTDTVVVTGKALNEDKTPLADATLKLHRSLNSTCLLPDHYKDVQTDEAGAWKHQLTGAETQNGELARCFLLRLPEPESGATASVRFLMQVTEIDVPELQRWGGGLEVDESGQGAVATFKSINETHGFDAEPSFSLTLGAHPAWRFGKVTSPVTLTDLMLEDFEGLKARVHVDRELRGSGTRFDLVYGSDAVTLAKKNKVPVSRGLGCQFGAKPFDAGACPATDGKLVHNIPAEAAADLRIDFAQPTKLGTLVLRDFGYTNGANVVIEGSTNGGVSFEPLVAQGSEAIDSHAVITLDQAAPPVNAFRLRVAGDGEPKILGLRQVSLFE